jgi:RimJ/RimL family protein N-acetyltransferase
MSLRAPIETPLVRLVPMDRKQADALRQGELLGIRAGRGWPHTDTLDAIGAAIAGEDPEALPWLILLRSDGVVVGDLGWKGTPSTDGEVEIGYGLSAAYRGRGLATHAVGALVEWLRTQQTVLRVVAQTDSDNTPSRRVLERLGFTVTGEDRDGVWYALDVGQVTDE